MPKPIPLEAGSKAPPFSYKKEGLKVSSDRLPGPCLIYFYPKDDTPGCTKEACGIRDAWSEFQDAGLEVVGVSKDDENSHQKFRTKYELPFPLIADVDLTLCRAFGVYGEKKFMGKVYDGIHRISFLISEDGNILKTYHKVKPAEHAQEVLHDLAQLSH